MNQDRFSKKSKSIRLKALMFTLAVHFAIIGGAIYGSGGGEPADFMPDFIKEYFENGKEAVEPKEESSKKKKKKKKRKDQA